MMIVIGIILALVAIALPTAFSLVSDSRAKQTKATMNTVAAAIEQFGKDNPFIRNGAVLRSVTNPSPPPPDYITWTIPRIFDRYPPSPTAAFSINPDTDANHANQSVFLSNGLVDINGNILPGPPYPTTKENDTEPPTGSNTQAVTVTKFLRLIHRMNNNNDLWQPTCRPWIIQNDKGQQIRYWEAPQFTEQSASIECLVYALREFSPGARNIIDKLPSNVLTNLDKDFVFHDVPPPGSPDCGNLQFDPGWEKPFNLFEIVDAWPWEGGKGRPLRWAIREQWQPTPTAGFTFKWELRSAGEDGVFSPPFTEESRSDDVILQGP